MSEYATPRVKVFQQNPLIQSETAVTYTYDVSGNQTSRAEGGATTTYIYDAANQLYYVGVNGTLIMGFSYDSQGHRTSKAQYTYDENGSRIVTSTKYICDGLDTLISKVEYVIKEFNYLDPSGNMVVSSRATDGNLGATKPSGTFTTIAMEIL